MIQKVLSIIFILGLSNTEVFGAGGWLLCYRCNSNQPGCGTPLNWLWYWGEYCPEEKDACVKVIERKGGKIVHFVMTSGKLVEALARWHNRNGLNNVPIGVTNNIFRYKSWKPETMITRECLSSLRGFRTDIPADQYEGCRPAAKDVRLGHYVNNSITQLDIHRDYYDETTWCFCYFDNRCNGANNLKITGFFVLLTVLIQNFTS